MSGRVALGGPPRAGSAADPASLRRGAGFSLVELLAAVLLMAIVLGVATDGLLDLTRQSEAAVQSLETPRRAMAILDRVARDLEGAVLMTKPEGQDPLYHPWLFFAEDQDEIPGAERAKWVSQNRRPRSERLAESNLEQVAWWLDRDELGEPLLRRSAVPGLPPGLDRDFPVADDASLVARNVAEFGLRFRSADGAWFEEWDSSLLTNASDLPVAAEIALSLYPDADSSEIEGPYQRVVLLPLRPLDLENLLGDGGAGTDNDQEGEDDERETGSDGMSLSACLQAHPELLAGLDEGTVDVVSQLQGAAVDLADLLPFNLPADCL